MLEKAQKYIILLTPFLTVLPYSEQLACDHFCLPNFFNFKRWSDMILAYYLLHGMFSVDASTLLTFATYRSTIRVITSNLVNQELVQM